MLFSGPPRFKFQASSMPPQRPASIIRSRTNAMLSWRCDRLTPATRRSGISARRPRRPLLRPSSASLLREGRSAGRASATAAARRRCLRREEALRQRPRARDVGIEGPDAPVEPDAGRQLLVDRELGLGDPLRHGHNRDHRAERLVRRDLKSVKDRTNWSAPGGIASRRNSGVRLAAVDAPTGDSGTGAWSSAAVTTAKLTASE